MLVIHSRDDEIVPVRHGQAIFAAAREPKWFVELRGTHNDAFLRDEQKYLAGLRSFLSELIDNTRVGAICFQTRKSNGTRQ